MSQKHNIPITGLEHDSMGEGDALALPQRFDPETSVIPTRSAMLTILERAQRDVDEGRVVPHDDAMARIRKMRDEE